MSLDTWRRNHDGTLEHDVSTLSITRLQPNRWSAVSWRLDGWRNERVPEHPKNTREGWKRVEFTLGTYATLREAKHAGEMHVRTRDGGNPRGTIADWAKTRDALREHAELLNAQADWGFWDDVVVGDSNDPWTGYLDDVVSDVESLAEVLHGAAATLRARAGKAKKLAKLDALAAHAATPAHEAAAARKAAGRLRGNGPA